MLNGVLRSDAGGARFTRPTPERENRAPHVLQIGMLWGQGGTAGGLDSIYTDLVSHLPNHGFEVTGTVHGPDDVEALSAGRVHSFAPRNASMLRRYRGTRGLTGKILRTQQIDLVVVHFALYGALAQDHLRGYPLIVHFQGPWCGESAVEGGSRLSVQAKYWIERQFYKRADRIVVLSRAFADLITREFGVAEDCVQVVPAHVDLDRFAPRVTRAEARAMLGWPNDRPILISVRRLRNRMGLDRLIEAIRIVAKAVPDVLLYIGGTGPQADTLRQQVADAGLERHVRFLGFVPEADLPLAYRAADLNVVPTLALEGFGLVAAEALASGTPSLVTPVGGLPEVVSPLCSALVVPSTGVPDLADGLIAALRGQIDLPDEATCLAYATMTFSRERAISRIADIYRDVLG